MSGLILCSKLSQIPYKIPDTDINIYSIEELAYYLYNNAYFVDESFFDEYLVDYVEKKLNLSKVAQKLRYGIGQKMNFAELVMIIINASMYYNENEVKKFEKELRAIGSKNMLERMKARADMLLANGKIGSAKKTYEGIINNKLYKRQNDEFYAEVYLGLGKACARMFYLKDAIDSFNKSLSLVESEKAKMILAETIMIKNYLENGGSDGNGSRDILDRVGADAFEKAKSALNEKLDLIKNSAEYERVNKIFQYDGRRNLDDYYEHIQDTLDLWKCEYRNELG